MTQIQELHKIRMVCPTVNSNSSSSDFIKSVSKPEFPKWKLRHRNMEVAGPRMGKGRSSALSVPAVAADACRGHTEHKDSPSSPGPAICDLDFNTWGKQCEYLLQRDWPFLFHLIPLRPFVFFISVPSSNNQFYIITYSVEQIFLVFILHSI